MMMFKLRAVVVFALVNIFYAIYFTSTTISDKTINLHRTEDFLAVIVAFVFLGVLINFLAGLMAYVIDGVKH